MSEAQLGLLTVTPIIVGFAAAMRATGALSTAATMFVAAASITIAVVLFVTQ